MVQDFAPMNASVRKHPLCLAGCALLLFFGVLFSQISQTKLIITGEEIHQAGMIRLSDLFLLIDSWNGNSVDDFDWRLSANTLDHTDQQSWFILLNGQRIYLESLHTNNINLLPVSVEQIDSVVIINTPSLYQNEFADRGIIHIYTTQIDSSLALHGRMALGNETGDPGPYRYTPHRTPNKDRAAHDESFGVSYAFANLYFGLHQKNLVHYPTSESIIQRVWYPLIGNDYPCIDVSATFLDGYYKNQQWNFGYTFNRDHLFVKPFGREIPVKRTLVFGSVNGTLVHNIRYALNYQNNYCFERANSYDIDFDRRIQFLQAQIWHKSNSSYMGLGFQKYLFNSGYLPQKKESNRLKFSAAYTSMIADLLRQTISGQVLVSTAFTTIKFSLRYNYTLSKACSIEGTAAYSERHYEETDAYDGLPPGWVDIQTVGDGKKSRLLTGDLCSRYQLFETLQGQAGVKYRKHFSALVEEQPFHYQGQHHGFTGPLTLYSDARGETAVLTVELAHQINLRLKHKLYYYNRIYSAGDDIFKEAWMPTPRHKLTYMITLQPFGQASIWTKITWLSPTHWPDYRYIAEESDFRYQDRIPAIFNWDLTIQKSIWKNRLRGSLVFRNLLNTEQWSFPVGAVHTLRFYLQVELKIDAF
jgi:hypothetical protein